MKWPYPVNYNVENEVDADLLVLGGGLAGPMAAITAAKKGLKVVLVDKGCTMHSGSAGSGIDHWVGCPNPASPISPEELFEFALQNQNGYINGIAQYIKAKHEDLGITAEWRQNFDVAVLATFMGVPKEGPSAGITIVTGIVSALKNIPVRNDLAMTGEITIMGKVLPVGGIQQKIRAAYDAEVKEVILPADNLKEARGLPSYILDKMTLTPVETIENVLEKALLDTKPS